MEKQIELFVPGRLCLFGEHTDWAGYHRMINSDVTEGKAIVTGIDQGIYARAKKSDELFISTLTPDGKRVEFSCEMNLELLKNKRPKTIIFLTHAVLPLISVNITAQKALRCMSLTLPSR